jgi:hypothetical protein
MKATMRSDKLCWLLHTGNPAPDKASKHVRKGRLQEAGGLEGLHVHTQ